MDGGVIPGGERTQHFNTAGTAGEEKREQTPELHVKREVSVFDRADGGKLQN